MAPDDPVLAHGVRSVLRGCDVRAYRGVGMSELEELREFESAVRRAYASTEGLSPFFAGRKLRRLIRELVEERRKLDAELRGLSSKVEGDEPEARRRK
jgi:hypothetical protein